MEYGLLVIGLVIGGGFGFFYAKSKFQSTNSSVNLDDYILKDLFISEQNKSSELDQKLSELSSNNILIEKQNASHLNEIENLGKQIVSFEENLRNQELLIAENAQQKENILNLNQKLDEQEENLIKQQDLLKEQFKNLANDILDEKSKKFTEQNRENIESILNPLGIKIKDFELLINQKYDLNKQVSQGAENLANALKGDSKIQGDWGEHQLEVLLENSGLEKGIQYNMQFSSKDEEGKQKRPDCIINLPDNKNLIIDSKVSLTAFEQYHSAKTEDERKINLKKHIDSIKKHIKDLDSKNYQKLYSINSPDYVLMYVPIEPAFILASQNDTSLFRFGLDKNIILVTNSTLLATLRTVSFVWQQENQKKNVLEIARQSGALYDKFVGFVEDLKNIDNHLKKTHEAYDGAMNKLKTGRGNLIGRVEKLKDYGINPKKSIDSNLIEE